MRRINDALADLIFTDVASHVAKQLLALSERFGVEEPDGVRVRHDLTQEELGQLVGTSRESVSKTLREFAARGWIPLDSLSLTILNPSDWPAAPAEASVVQGECVAASATRRPSSLPMTPVRRIARVPGRRLAERLRRIRGPARTAPPSWSTRGPSIAPVAVEALRPGHSGVDMDEREVLRKLAEDKIVGESGKALDVIGEAAAALIADLYAAGLAHGITPDDWAWVTALPGACWDASRALARRQQTAVEEL